MLPDRLGGLRFPARIHPQRLPSVGGQFFAQPQCQTGLPGSPISGHQAHPHTPVGYAPGQQLIQLRAPPERHHLLFRPQIAGDAKSRPLARAHPSSSRSSTGFGGANISSNSRLRAARAACRACRSHISVTTAEPTRPTRAVITPAATPAVLPARAPSAIVTSTPAAPTVTVRESTLI